MIVVIGESITAESLPMKKCPTHGSMWTYVANKSAAVTEVVYTCEEGFMLHGDHKRYCQRNGQWTGTRRDPHCSIGEAEGLVWSDLMW